MIKNLISLTLLMLTISCNQKNDKKGLDVTEEKPAAIEAKPEAALKTLTFASKKDLVCEMPITAGVSDTITYKGKLYGFCAKECKDEFIKNPNEYLTSKK